ncbi:MAG: exodeoxyribonuclease V subunit gamma [Prevotellaceae bacterium]|jgi:DNA helicase-2/ATP-dependent DNA helicase PcrA|nr:exodeoxyribonuclease V subunit gamma [Prevotellaceae bacterium]
MNPNFLDELNESQRAAVEFIDGASLVIAGAGSGKTRVLTCKIAFLMENDYSPASIMALTFTNKAAREMKSRIATLVGEKRARYLMMGTFHSIFSRMLRREADKLGYTKNFSIYDSADSKNLIKTIIKELKLSDKEYKPAVVHSRISYAKNNLITAAAYAGSADALKYDNSIKMPLISDIYKIYAARCKQADAMDFDDLLLNTNVLFRSFPDVLAQYQMFFRYILVDEYQDTNFAQYMIVKKLAENHEHICVVGDDAQSIYSFRGANIDNILQFKSNYPNAKIFKLEQNYRSTQNIVNAANSLIEKNKNRIEKNVFSEKEKGNRVKVFSVHTDLEEGTLVANQIKDLRDKQDIDYESFAVLYRTNAQSRVLEEAMRKAAIPYRIYGGLSFYQRKEIKDIIAYCRIICNQNDEEALKRIVNFPARGIGDTTVGKISECSVNHDVTMWAVLSDMLRYNLPVNAGTATKLAKFRDLIDNFAQKVGTENAYELVTQIITQTEIIADTYSAPTPENMSRRENVEEFMKAVHEFCEQKATEGVENVLLTYFLSEIALISDQDENLDDKKSKVTLMTVHSAKGLEFRVVFIVGLEEDLFPSGYSYSDPKQLEEERRLFYVALTRAEEYCIISYAKSRFRNGQTNFSNPSRFIKDIDSQYLDLPDEDKFEANFSRKLFKEDNWTAERENFESFHKLRLETHVLQRDKTDAKNLTRLQTDFSHPLTQVETAYKSGTFVKHSVFGVGKVITCALEGGNKKIVIDFAEKGKKTLLLKFAKLEILQ